MRLFSLKFQAIFSMCLIRVAQMCFAEKQDLSPDGKYEVCFLTLERWHMKFSRIFCVTLHSLPLMGSLDFSQVLSCKVCMTYTTTSSMHGVPLWWMTIFHAFQEHGSLV